MGTWWHRKQALYIEYKNTSLLAALLTCFTQIERKTKYHLNIYLYRLYLTHQERYQYVQPNVRPNTSTWSPYKDIFMLTKPGCCSGTFNRQSFKLYLNPAQLWTQCFLFFINWHGSDVSIPSATQVSIGVQHSHMTHCKLCVIHSYQHTNVCT